MSLLKSGKQIDWTVAVLLSLCLSNFGYTYLQFNKVEKIALNAGTKATMERIEYKIDYTFMTTTKLFNKIDPDFDVRVDKYLQGGKSK